MILDENEILNVHTNLQNHDYADLKKLDHIYHPATDKELILNICAEF